MAFFSIATCSHFFGWQNSRYLGLQNQKRRCFLQTRHARPLFYHSSVHPSRVSRCLSISASLESETEFERDLECQIRHAHLFAVTQQISELLRQVWSRLLFQTLRRLYV